MQKTYKLKGNGLDRTRVRLLVGKRVLSKAS